MISEPRGSLVLGEFGAGLPFHPARFFLVFDVPSGTSRGGHAHRSLHQFLVCCRGNCRLALDDGWRRQEIELNDPRTGVHLAPMVWASQSQFSSDALLLVLASSPYDPTEYVCDYDEFIRLVTTRPAQRSHGKATS